MEFFNAFSIPFEPTIGAFPINVHFIFETLAFLLAFRYYLFLRKKSRDSISSGNRLSIIVGAVFGALIGSRFFAYLEQPLIDFTFEKVIYLLNSKTIMGGLFGGLIGVELAKKVIGETKSSGDLFTLPIVLGIFIGRIGCFLSGIKEFTYGKPTDFFMGMDLGDGILRHPTSLYELLFLIVLFLFLKRIKKIDNLESGYLFQIFMLSYFGFRFFIEFIKPNIFFILGLSSIQCLCILCFIYYRKTILKFLKYANKKIYLL